MTEKAAVVTQEPEIVVPTKDFVKYTGPATTRIIRVEEWPASVKSSNRPKGDLVWNKFNHWTLKKSDLSADVLSVLEQDGSFAISEK